MPGWKFSRFMWRVCDIWSARAEESGVNNKIPDLPKKTLCFSGIIDTDQLDLRMFKKKPESLSLRWNLLESGSRESVHRSCAPELVKTAPYAGSQARLCKSHHGGTGFEVIKGSWKTVEFGAVGGQERALEKDQPHWHLKPSIKGVKQKIREKLETIKSTQ